MATTTNHYDLIVLGSDVAGLVCAALVARRGKRVLVLPHGAAEGTYRIAGRTLPLDTAPVVHMGTSPVRRVFHELGLLQQVRRQHAAVEEFVHVALPRERLDLLPGGANFEAEALRCWPEDSVQEAWALAERWGRATDDVLEQLLTSENTLAADGFWGRRFLSRIASQLPGPDVDELAPLPSDHPLRSTYRSPEPWLTSLTPSQLGKAARLRLGRLWFQGPEELDGGMPRLRELLLQRIELHSGEVKRDLRVADLLVKRGKIAGVSLLGKRDRYGCDHMILATDPHRLLDGTFHAEGMPKSLVGLLSSIETVAARFVMHLEIGRRGLSPGLAGMVLSLGDDGQEHGIGHTYLRLEPEPEGGDASEDGEPAPVRHLSVTRIVDPEADLGNLREQVLDDLDRQGVLPFCRPHIRWIHSPHDGRGITDGKGRADPDAPPDAEVALPMAPIYRSGREPSLGVGVLPTSSGLRGLYFASRLTLPGLGLEGEFVSGTMAASVIASPAKSPFSRSPLLSKA